MTDPSVVLSIREIEDCIWQLALAAWDHADRVGQPLTVLADANTATVFAGDLCRCLPVDRQAGLHWFGALSRNERREDDQILCLFRNETIVYKHVLVLHGVVNTGATAALADWLFRRAGVASIAHLALVERSGNRVTNNPELLTVGFRLAHDPPYVYGYGMALHDGTQRHRACLWRFPGA